LLIIKYKRWKYSTKKQSASKSRKRLRSLNKSKKKLERKLRQTVPQPKVSSMAAIPAIAVLSAMLMVRKFYQMKAD